MALASSASGRDGVPGWSRAHPAALRALLGSHVEHDLEIVFARWRMKERVRPIRPWRPLAG